MATQEERELVTWGSTALLSALSARDFIDKEHKAVGKDAEVKATQAS